jgi:hypothetical protein
MKQAVMVPFGRSSMWSSWIVNSANRPFDVVLLTYHEPASIKGLELNSPHYQVLDLHDFKWVMIQNLFTQSPEWLDKYDYFFFVDDDIEITEEGIISLFQLCRHHQLLLSQPVLTRDSYKSWRVLRKKYIAGIRYLSTVELMCPVMHRDAIRKLLSTFSLNQSGWGIDILWGNLLRKEYGNYRIAVFDQISARHTKPVGKGELYNKLGKTAVEERDEIFHTYHLPETKIFELPVPENSFLEKRKSYFKIRKWLKENEFIA